MYLPNFLIFYRTNYIIKVALIKLLEELITINKGERIKNYNIQKKLQDIRYFNGKKYKFK